MSDIVERLRRDAEGWVGATHTVTGPSIADLEREAADEIERLRAALQRLVDNILDYERVNKLAPNPPRMYCWDAVADAVAILPPAAATVAATTEATAAEAAGVAPAERTKR
jgi:hypothetical protein